MKETERQPVQIVHGEPPAWIMEGCLNKFRIDVSRTFWTYGDVIYNPGGMTLPDHIIAHETTHMRQQRDYPGGKDAWWKRFLTDTEFRIEQEGQAYAVQYGFFCVGNKDRNRRATFLLQLASSMSGPLYQADLTRAEAQDYIRRTAPNFTRA